MKVEESLGERWLMACRFRFVTSPFILKIAALYETGFWNQLEYFSK